MSKISELSDGGSLLPTDYLIAVRSGGNVKVQADTINVDQIDLGDNEKIRLGNSQDLQIYHDGSGSYIDDIGTGNLFVRADSLQLRRADGSQLYLAANTGAEVALYHAGNSKLATTSTGIDVTGTAVTDGLTVAGNLDVDGGTIKLDGNYPVGTSNVALGDQALNGSITGQSNTGVGAAAGFSMTSGSHNTAVGTASLLDNTSGSYNTALGRDALRVNTTASNNTAVGYQALTANTTASYNTAVGYQAAYSNTTGINTAIGQGSLYANTTGTSNTALGKNSLGSNTTASNNTAVGYQAGYSNVIGADNTYLGFASGFSGTGYYNTAVGKYSLYNSTGSYNTAIGKDALLSNTTASNNTAVGYQSLYSITTGDKNTAFGYLAGYSVTTGSGNTFVGGSDSGGANPAGYSVTTATNNSFFGSGAGGVVTTGSKNTILGAFNGNEGSLDIRTSSNNIVLSDGDGNPRALWDSAGNMYQWTSGSGIYIGGASSANLLDDYEEGTWTPVVYNATTTTYTTQTGYYRKVGDLVFVYALLHVDSIGDGSANQMSGLPFSAGAECTININKLSSCPTNFYSIQLRTSGNLLYASSQTALDSSITTNVNFLGNSTLIQVSGCYNDTI